MTVIADSTQNLAVSVPHIQESIFRHGGLSQHDLANASRVSRIWFQIITPFLWEDIIIITTDSTPKWLKGFQSGLLTYGEWTKTVTTTSDGVLDWLSESPTCTRLLTIDARELTDNQPYRNSMQKLVSKNPKLQILRWHAEQLVDYEQFGDVCDGLMNPNSRFLSTIDLSRIELGNRFYWLLKHHSAAMKHLLLKECFVYSDISCTFKEERLNLKTLVLERSDFKNDPRDFKLMDYFTSLVKITNGLIEFGLTTYYRVLIRQLLQLFKTGKGNDGQDGPFAFLEILRVKNSNRRILPEDIIEELLDALPDTLSKLSLNGFSVEHLGNLGFRSFTSRNQDRLTSIKLVKCRGISSETWKMILTSCRNLKEIEGIESSCLEVEIGCNEPWVCLGLERFTMTFELDTRWVGSGEKVILKDCEKLFSQLGALLQLRRLNIELIGGRLSVLWASKAEEEFRLFWSRMKTCTHLEEVSGIIYFPNMWLKTLELQSLSREMWGDQVEFGVKVH